MNHRKSNGNTLLHEAAEYDKPECIQFFAYEGLAIDLKNKRFKTPEDIAFWKEHMKSYSILVDLKKAIPVINAKLEWEDFLMRREEEAIIWKKREKEEKDGESEEVEETREE